MDLQLSNYIPFSNHDCLYQSITTQASACNSHVWHTISPTRCYLRLLWPHERTPWGTATTFTFYIHPHTNNIGQQGFTANEDVHSHENPREQFNTNNNNTTTLPPFEPYQTNSSNSRTLVVARTQKDDVSWIEKELGSLPSLNIAVYTVDDPSSQYHVPKNKGNEAMVYLTYLIDNYDNLSEVTMVRFEASSLRLSSPRPIFAHVQHCSDNSKLAIADFSRINSSYTPTSHHGTTMASSATAQR